VRLDEGCRLSDDRKLHALDERLEPSLGIFATISPIRAVLAPANPVHHVSSFTHSPNMAESNRNNVVEEASASGFKMLLG
jgi:hypothetical protein